MVRIVAAAEGYIPSYRTQDVDHVSLTQGNQCFQQFDLIAYEEIRSHHERAVDVVAVVFGYALRDVGELSFCGGHLEHCIVQAEEDDWCVLRGSLRDLSQ